MCTFWASPRAVVLKAVVIGVVLSPPRRYLGGGEGVGDGASIYLGVNGKSIFLRESSGKSGFPRELKLFRWNRRGDTCTGSGTFPISRGLPRERPGILFVLLFSPAVIWGGRRRWSAHALVEDSKSILPWGSYSWEWEIKTSTALFWMRPRERYFARDRKCFPGIPWNPCGFFPCYK